MWVMPYQMCQDIAREQESFLIEARLVTPLPTPPLPRGELTWYLSECRNTPLFEPVSEAISNVSRYRQGTEVFFNRSLSSYSPPHSPEVLTWYLSECRITPLFEPVGEAISIVSRCHRGTGFFFNSTVWLPGLLPPRWTTWYLWERPFQMYPDVTGGQESSLIAESSYPTTPPTPTHTLLLPSPRSTHLVSICM